MRTTKKVQQGIWGALGFTVLGLGLAPTETLAQIVASKKFSFQGVVSGIADGDYEMKVDIVGGVTNHTVIFDNTRKVPVRGGVFTLLIDESDGLLPAHFFKDNGTNFTFNLHVDHDSNQAGYDSVFSGIPVTAVPVAFVAHEALKSKDAERLKGLDVVDWPDLPIAGALPNPGDNGKVLKIINGKIALGDDNDSGLTSVPAATTSVVGGFMLPGTSSSHSFLNSNGTFQTLPAVSASQAGLVPAFDNTSTNYFAGDGQWRALPAGFTLQTAGPTQLGGVQIPSTGSALFMASNDLKVKVKASNPLVINGSNELEFSNPNDTSKWMRGDGSWQALPSLAIASTSLGGVKTSTGSSVSIDGAGLMDVKLAASSGLSRAGNGDLSVKVKSSNPLILNGSNELEVSVGTAAGTVAAGNDSRFNNGVPVGTVISSVRPTPPTGYLAADGSRADTTSYAALAAYFTAPEHSVVASDPQNIQTGVTLGYIKAIIGQSNRLFSTKAEDYGSLMRSDNYGQSVTVVSEGSQNWNSMATDGSGTVVAIRNVYNSGNYDTLMTRSTDNGVTWSAAATVVSNAAGYDRIIWSGSQFVMFGYNATPRTSADGTTWSLASGPNVTASYAPVVDGAGKILVQGYSSPSDKIFYSSDHGSSWNSYDIYSAGALGYRASSGRYCFVTSSSGPSRWSTTGADNSWTYGSTTLPGSLNLYSAGVMNVGNFFLVVEAPSGSTMKTWISSDCSTWVSGPVIPMANLTASVSHGGEAHFFGSNNGVAQGKYYKIFVSGTEFRLPYVNPADGLFRYIKY